MVTFKRRMRLLKELLKREPKAVPPSKKTWGESFTEHKGDLYLWYNLETGHTHVIRESKCFSE